MRPPSEGAVTRSHRCPKPLAEPIHAVPASPHSAHSAPLPACCMCVRVACFLQQERDKPSAAHPQKRWGSGNQGKNAGQVAKCSAMRLRAARRGASGRIQSRHTHSRLGLMHEVQQQAGRVPAGNPRRRQLHPGVPAQPAHGAGNVCTQNDVQGAGMLQPRGKLCGTSGTAPGRAARQGMVFLRLSFLSSTITGRTCRIPQPAAPGGLPHPSLSPPPAHPPG